MALTAEQSVVVRTQIAECLKIDPVRVIPQANFFTDLGGTGEHLQPVRLAIEQALQVAIEPIVTHVNGLTSVGPNGLLTVPSLVRINQYLGEQSLIPKAPVPFPVIFTVAFIEAMTEKALRAEPDSKQSGPAEALSLSSEYSRVVREQLALFLEVPVERLVSSARLVTDLAGDELMLGFALSRIEIELGVALIDEWRRFLTHLIELTGDNPSADAIQLQTIFPELKERDRISIEETLTVGLIEQIVAQAIARRESAAIAQSGETRPAAQSPIVAAWTWSQQDWMWQLPDILGPRKLRLLLAGGCRDASGPREQLEWEVVEVFEIMERFADTGKNITALNKAHRKVGNWRIWRNPELAALHYSLSEDNPDAALPRMVTAVALKHELDNAAAFERLQRLVGELVSPSPELEFKSDWRTPEIFELAWSMYEKRDFREMTRLADLLEQVDCHESAIIDHCRDPQAIHFRGCWVIDAILDGCWANPPKPKRSKVKTLLSTLPKRDQRDFQNFLEGPSGNMSISELLSQTDESDLPRMLQAYAPVFPGLQQEQLLQMVLLSQAIEHRRVLVETALIHRIVREEASDLIPAISLTCRLEWIRCFLFPETIHAAKFIQEAFAIRDETFIRHAAKTAPRRQSMNWDNDYLIYAATLAVVDHDVDWLQQITTRMSQRPPRPEFQGTELVFRGLAQRDAAVVQQGLQQQLEFERQAKYKTGHGIICLEAHSMYRMAEWVSTDLVADFDTTQTYPWDADFHRCVDRVSEPLAELDFSRLSDVTREAIVNLTFPEWMKPSPRYANIGFCDIVLTSIGPNPKKVIRILGNIVEGSRDTLAQLIEVLPATVRSRAAKAIAISSKEELETVGATVELHD